MDATARSARKLAFFDAMTADPSVSDLQCRIGWRILMRMRDSEGPAWPAYETLAEEVGCSRRSAIRAVAALVDAGWFTKFASKGGVWYARDGKTHGKPNHLLANWSRVTPESPLDPSTVTPASPLEHVDGGSRVTQTTAKGDSGDRKGDSGDIKGDSGVTRILLLNPVTESINANPFKPRGRARDDATPCNAAAVEQDRPAEAAAETPEVARQGGRAGSRAAPRTASAAEMAGPDDQIARIVADTAGWGAVSRIIDDRYLTGPDWPVLKAHLLSVFESTGTITEQDLFDFRDQHPASPENPDTATDSKGAAA